MSDLDDPSLHEGALRALEAADTALAHVTDLAVDGPHLLDDVTPEFLAEVLTAAAPGARLLQVTVAAEHAGMTDRRRLLLSWDDAGQAAGLPRAVFVKATPEGPFLRETLAVLHMAENEVNFYNRVQPEVPDLAPRAHYARSYPGGRFLLVVEDLESAGLRPYVLADECTLAHALAVAEAQARLHARYWESPRFATDLSWVRPRTRRFGFHWHQATFGLARAAYLDGPAGQLLPPELRDLVRFWDANDRAVYDYWDSLPQTVLHGDSHLANTFARPDGRAGYYDWQVVYRGHGPRDLAYFVLNGVSDELRRAHERDIFGRYAGTLRELGVAFDEDRLWRDYCLFAMDRLDAHMKTYTRGGYGHAAEAVERSRLCIIGALLDNDVPRLVADAVARG